MVQQTAWIIWIFNPGASWTMGGATRTAELALFDASHGFKYGFIPSSQTLQISQNLLTGPLHDSYEPEGFAFPHFHPAHPAHPPHFLPAYPVHHMPPHFHQPELYGFAPRHPYEWHGSLAARGIP